MKRLLPFLLLLVACAPQTDGTYKPFTHQDGHAAIDQAFARYGPAIVNCAHGIASRESNHWPYAGFGKKYKGQFQMHDGFQGSYQRAVAELDAAGWPGHLASPFDPYVQSLAARYAFEVAGGSFRANWVSTTPGGCP